MNRKRFNEGQIIGILKESEAITVENGPEIPVNAMRFWSRRTGVDLPYIQSDKPIQNALVESFNGKLRDPFLNVQWAVDPADAGRSIEAWRTH